MPEHCSGGETRFFNPVLEVNRYPYTQPPTNKQTTDLSTDRRDIHNQIYVSKQPININNNNDNQQLVIIRPSVCQNLEREAHPNRNDIISLPDPV